MSQFFHGLVSLIMAFSAVAFADISLAQTVVEGTTIQHTNQEGINIGTGNGIVQSSQQFSVQDINGITVGHGVTSVTGINLTNTNQSLGNIGVGNVGIQDSTSINGQFLNGNTNIEQNLE